MIFSLAARSCQRRGRATSKAWWRRPRPMSVAPKENGCAGSTC